MNIKGVEYEGNPEYDPLVSNSLRFKASLDETKRIVGMLNGSSESRNTPIVDLSRNILHCENTGIGTYATIPGVEPLPPYIEVHMQKLKNGSSGQIDTIIRVPEVEGKITKDHVEAGRLTLREIAEVLGLI